jgi:hypothetical protein
MLHVLTVVRRRLERDTARSGFVVTDLDGTDAAGNNGVAHLEYRAELPGPRRLLLDFCHLTERQTIAGTLWSPMDLHGASPQPTIDAVARRYRLWQYDQFTSPDELAREIVNEVVTWLGSEPAL